MAATIVAPISRPVRLECSLFVNCDIVQDAAVGQLQTVWLPNVLVARVVKAYLLSVFD